MSPLLRYLDIRKPLYERLTFVLHRAETAIDFLSARNTAILPDIRYIQLSLNFDAPLPMPWLYLPRPELPWHAGIREWLKLRDRLPELESLRSLSIWLDAASQHVRGHLLNLERPLDFDARLVPFVRVSLPVSEREDGRLAAGTSREVVFQPREYAVIARGNSEFSQEARIAPAITWYPIYDVVPLYRLEPELYALQQQTEQETEQQTEQETGQETEQQQTQASSSRRRGLIEALSGVYGGWKMRRHGERGRR